MLVYTIIGLDGKEQSYVYANDNQTTIYKQRKKELMQWMKMLIKRMRAAKYSDAEIEKAIRIFVNKGYFKSIRYYIPEWQLVQRLNDLGFENIEYV